MRSAADATAAVVLAILLVALLLTLVRLLYGPTHADRVVALDLASILSVGVAEVFAFVYEDPLFVDVALVLAVTSFLATLGLARYLYIRAES